MTLTPQEIRQIRGHLTREQFADLLHVTTQTVYRWECGKVEPRSRIRTQIQALLNDSEES